MRNGVVHGGRNQERSPHNSAGFVLWRMTVAFCYIVGTVCVLLALPSSEVSPLQGLVQAIARRAIASDFLFSSVAAFLIALSNIGASGAYLAPSHVYLLWLALITICRLHSEAASPLGDALGRAVGPGGHRRDFIFLGRRERPSRGLRRAGEHGRDHVFHSVLIFVCIDVQTARERREKK